MMDRSGLEDSITAFIHQALAPVASALFRGVGARLDSHHSFMVQYKAGEDLGLDMCAEASKLALVMLGIKAWMRCMVVQPDEYIGQAHGRCRRDVQYLSGS
jgi:hypothetical protein